MRKAAEVDSARADGSAGVQSVDRALSILEVLARVGEAGVTEIAGELGVHKSTAFRLVATLESHRLVEQSSDRGKYRLGVGVLRLAGATSARLDLVQEARPICRQLAADTGETVNIAVLSESSALYLDQIAGSSALQPHNWVGQHIPLHATSNGKVLLSGLDQPAARRGARQAADVHPRDHHPEGRSCARSWPAGPRAGVRRRGRRARGRPDRRRGADPQRARRRGRVDERLRADVPAHGGPHRRGRRPAAWTPPTRSRTGSAGVNVRSSATARTLDGTGRVAAFSETANGCAGEQSVARYATQTGCGEWVSWRLDSTSAARGHPRAPERAARSAARPTARWSPRSTRPARRTPTPPSPPRTTPSTTARGRAPPSRERGDLLLKVADLLERDTRRGRPDGEPRHRQAAGRERVRRRRRRVGLPPLRPRRRPRTPAGWSTPATPTWSAGSCTSRSASAG